jgi:hypothetical protein
MKSRLILLIVIILVVPIICEAQQEKNTKTGVLLQYNVYESFSIRLEESIISKEKLGLRPYIGFSHTEPKYNSLRFNWYGFPLGINVILGKRKSHFETGIGYWWLKSYHSDPNYVSRIENVYQLKLGYRYQNLKKPGLILRIGMTPGFSSSFDIDYRTTDTYNSFYLSIGFGF